MRRAIKRKRPGKRFLFHWDNAPCHTAGLTVDMLESIGLPILQHALYSPDLAPNDFYLYGELKRELRGIQFTSVEDHRQAIMDRLNAMSRDGFKKVFLEWACRHERCIELNGPYVE